MSLPVTAVAAEGGNLTLLCQPEAAPQAEIEWMLNGGTITPDNRRQVRQTTIDTFIIIITIIIINYYYNYDVIYSSFLF